MDIEKGEKCLDFLDFFSNVKPHRYYVGVLQFGTQALSDAWFAWRIIVMRHKLKRKRKSNPLWKSF